jgi:hypothetical protein
MLRQQAIRPAEGIEHNKCTANQKASAKIQSAAAAPASAQA